jgi:hypothetical protein
MQENLMAIVKYNDHDYPFYSVRKAEIAGDNPGYDIVERQIPQQFLYCDTHQLRFLEGDLQVGGKVKQYIRYPAVDAVDNKLFGIEGTIVAIGIEP